MTVHLYLLAAVLFLSAISVWWFFVKHVPSVYASVARHRLWEVRDEIWDARKNGWIPANELVGEAISEIEDLIASIRIASLWNILWYKRCGVTRSEVTIAIQDLEDSLTGEAKEFIHHCNNRINLALLWKMFLGSPSGLLGYTLITPIVLVNQCIKSGIQGCKQVLSSEYRGVPEAGSQISIKSGEILELASWKLKHNVQHAH